MKRTPELVARAVALAKSGMNTYAIGAELGVSQATAYRWVKEATGVVWNHSDPRSGVPTERIVRLREEEGRSFAAIAAAVGMSKSAVRERYRRWLRDGRSAAATDGGG